MNIWILVIPLAAGWLLAIAGWLLAGYRSAKLLQIAQQLRDTRTRIDEISLAYQEERATWDEQLADRNEALQEARAAIENLQTNLHMATVPMQDAVKSDVPLSYADTKPIIEQVAQTTPPKRTIRKPKAGQA